MSKNEGRASLATGPPPSTKPGTLRVGTAGFSYPDWIGPVFPRGGGGGAAALTALSRWVDLLEVNVSHYKIPDPDLATSWLHATASRAGFRFAAKIFRGYTHGPLAPTVAEHRAQRRFLDALAADGRLEAVLAQFPPSLRASERALAYVRRLVGHFDGLRLAVEFRDASWDRDDVFATLESDGVTCVIADLLPGRHAIAPRVPSAPASGSLAPLAYVRLHGRSAAWYQPGVGRDRRYDYLYGRDELRAWADRIATLRERAATVLVVANNHFGGQAVANALELKAIVGAGPVEGPASLLATFPRLADVVTPDACPGPVDPLDGGWFNPAP
jgi:uncharacterized protein YecE (DUF72 family)